MTAWSAPARVPYYAPSVLAVASLPVLWLCATVLREPLRATRVRTAMEGAMISATVRYKLPPHIDYAACREHFHTIAPDFRSVQGLISKHFIWSEGGWAGGIYQWETLEDAEAFYGGPWRE